MFLWDDEAPQPCVAAPLVPSGIAWILSGSARTRSLRASSSSLERPFTCWQCRSSSKYQSRWIYVAAKVDVLKDRMVVEKALVTICSLVIKFNAVVDVVMLSLWPMPLQVNFLHSRRKRFHLYTGDYSSIRDGINFLTLLSNSFKLRKCSR